MAALFAVLIAASPLLAQNGIPVSIEPKSPLPATERADHFDVVVLLDGGPLHMRLHVGLGGVSLAAARRQYVVQTMALLDTDKNGKLDRDEADRSPLLRTKRRKSAEPFLDKLRAQTPLIQRDIERKVDVIAGALVGFRDEMSSAKNDVEVFKLFDANANGSLEIAELGAAAELIMSKDEDGDQCVAFQEFFPPPPPVDPMQAALLAVNPPIPQLASHSDLVFQFKGDTPARLLKKYNRRLDQGLDASELGWTSDRFSALDQDASGLLDARELAELAAAEPDVELNVDLRAVETSGGQIGFAGGHSQRLDDATRPDYAKVASSGAVVTFSHRNLDPVTDSIETAMREFNTMDADANGYLSLDEVAERIRFQRELFELMDVDDDKKVFADEMKQYIRARAEPKAATCIMNLYDTGNGFFMALDSNADGRVSEREKRNAARSIAALDRDGKPGVGQTEPVRHFHIEFVRGTYTLFGASEQLLAQTPAFQQRTPSGPVWFQRMDKNNDGDLVWNEFFGHIELFHELDADHDDLLDPNEAAKANGGERQSPVVGVE
jgi:Ca2+-binding EF-hand superfamily protein